MRDLQKEIAEDYQEFFDFLNQEHNLILTKSEMDEIVFEAQKLVKKLSLGVVSNNEVAVCPNCKGTGRDGHDRCYPPNWYVCEICKGSG